MRRALVCFLAVLLAPMAEGSEMVIDLASAEEAGAWYAVNDGVMGGVSSGSMRMEEGVGVWAGTLSLENNGGFASVWRRPAEELGRQLSGTDALRLRVRGDGREYRVRLTTPELPDGVSYQQPVETVDGEWTEHKLPYDGFVPRFRGRTVSAPPLEPARVRGIGLLLADGQPGPFRLEVAWVRAD